MPDERPIHTAEILAVGSELLFGETRDTNTGDLARELTALGVEITRIALLHDDLDTLTEALSAARDRADLVVTSGGLGPTPDDLTREAIAAVLGLEPAVDAALEAWLRELWERRGIPFPASNLKQAWLIPGAGALPNPNGTAPGWWVDADGALFVALPGPPSELHPMWRDHVVPRLMARGLGTDRAAETLRLTGIGESAVADLLGEEVLRATRPHVATYARQDAVDVRIWATGDGQDTARALVDGGLAALEPILRPYVFARGAESWADALSARLAGRTLAVLEAGTAGQLTALLGAAPWLRRAELVTDVSHAADLAARCTDLRVRSGAPIGLGILAIDQGDDMRAEVAVDLGDAVSQAQHAIFRGGDVGRRRAANAACAELWRRLGGRSDGS
jgi:nicotinamide-nucleotide amidase